MSSMKRVTEKELVHLLGKWQFILNLRDWKIRVKFGNIGDFRPGVEGSCAVNEQHKSALILILDPSCYDAMGWEDEDYDAESILVHELLHVHLTFMDRFLPVDKKDDCHFIVPLEQAIESICPALINLTRGTVITKRRKNRVVNRRAKKATS